MIENQTVEAQLFYEFDLSSHLPPNHVLREIDWFFDIGNMRQKLKPFYSRIGFPSIDPELILRMLVIGYVMGIRSERRLCLEVDLNLACCWFCRLGLDDKVPDHSSFSQYRHGKLREGDLFCHIFETTAEDVLRNI